MFEFFFLKIFTNFRIFYLEASIRLLDQGGAYSFKPFFSVSEYLLFYATRPKSVDLEGLKNLLLHKSTRFPRLVSKVAGILAELITESEFECEKRCNPHIFSNEDLLS